MFKKGEKIGDSYASSLPFLPLFSICSQEGIQSAVLELSRTIILMGLFVVMQIFVSAHCFQAGPFHHLPQHIMVLSACLSW